MARKQEEPLGDDRNLTAGNFNAAALGGYVPPDVVQVCFSLRCEAVRHSSWRGLLGGESREAALVHLVAEDAQGFSGDDAAFATRERILRFIEGCQKLN